MYDIEELEAQWRRYRSRRLIRRGVIVLLILLALGLPVLYLEYFSPNEKKVQSPAVVGQKPIKASRTKSNLSALSMKKSPSSPDKRGDSGKMLETAPPSMKREETQREDSKKRPKMRIVFADEAAKGTDNGKQSRVELTMTKRDDRAVIRSIEKRFPLSRDYDDAMYLAKYYYSKHRYKKAEYWAMQANVVDSTKAESWMLFAKAKAKRGHRTEAIRVLQRYFDNTGDAQVKLLLDAMRKGRKY